MRYNSQCKIYINKYQLKQVICSYVNWRKTYFISDVIVDIQIIFVCILIRQASNKLWTY